MKKIRLKNLKLEASEMLGRNQLKTVLGGGYTPGGSAHKKAKCCWDSHPTSCSECVSPHSDCVAGAHLVH
ncbi:MAG: hypothetical protein VW080_04035, partial [Flavobacteriaceae bacterium]